MKFDYITAHSDLATPRFESLPDAIRQAVLLCDSLADELPQDPVTLNCPLHEKVVELIESLDAKTLNHAGAVVYYYGHWGSNKEVGRGGTWRLTNIIKQMLAQLPAQDLESLVGGRPFCEFPKKLLKPYYISETEFRIRHGDGCTPYRNRQERPKHPDGTDLAYLVEQLNSHLREAYKKAAWKLKGSESVNHRTKDGRVKHAFVIGPKHLRNSTLYLDPRAAPCAHSGYDYDEFIHETILIFSVREKLETLNVNQKKALLQTKKLLQEWGVIGKIQGFIFSHDETN